MAGVHENAFPTKSSIVAADKLRAIGSDDKSYQALVSEVAKYIVENYNGSTLLGSAQTVNSAFDSFKNRIIWNTRNDTKITTSLTDIVDSLGLGFHIRWNTASDATAVGAPTNHGYHYIINKMDASTAIVHAYRMGTNTFENYQKQKYGVDGWGSWIAW